MNALSRRNVLIGAGGAAGFAGVVVAARHLLRKRFAPSPYDDLLALIDDRDGAAQIGEAVLAEQGAFDPAAAATVLRQKLQHTTLTALAEADAAQGRLLEAGGWVLPESLAQLYALAAKAAA